MTVDKFFQRLCVACAVIAMAGTLLAGCASTAPAPVSERGSSAPAPKRQPTVTAPTPPPGSAPAAKADAGVVVTPLGAADGAPLYTVKPGDTLFSIAKTNGVAVRDVAAWNNIEDPASIRVGQQLRLTPPGGVAATPAPSTVTTAKPAESQPSDPNMKTQPLGQRVPYSEQAYAQMQKPAVVAAAPEVKPEAKPEVKPEAKPEVKPEAKAEAPRADGEVDWSWPTEGKVIANFNDGSNKGIVISGKRGQAVNASAAGRVIFSGTGIRGLGKLVVIRHNSNYLSVYAHNDNLLVKEGQNVRKGQRIAEMGNSDAEQVKLHFEIRRQGKPVDPAKLLPAT